MNPFQVLEVSSDASAEDIKASYHRLAKRWHPDRYMGEEKAEAEERFRELAEAFSILKDPTKRLNFEQQALKPDQSAVSEANQALERTPEDWANMAQSALEEGNLGQARALIHYAIRLEAGNAKHHALLAAILEREGEDLRAVVKALETAVRLAPRDVESHLRLAQHFQSLGLLARSQGHLQLAKEISPNHPKLRAAAARAGRSPKAKGPTPKPGAAEQAQDLIHQLKDLWGRWTRKG